MSVLVPLGTSVCGCGEDSGFKANFGATVEIGRGYGSCGLITEGFKIGEWANKSAEGRGASSMCLPGSGATR